MEVVEEVIGLGSFSTSSRGLKILLISEGTQIEKSESWILIYQFSSIEDLRIDTVWLYKFNQSSGGSGGWYFMWFKLINFISSGRFLKVISSDYCYSNQNQRQVDGLF